MRSLYTKRHKKNKRIRKRRIPSYKTAQFAYLRRITPDFDNINQVLNIRGSKLAKRFWKIMPKDSCEVYKIRRKRQIEKKNRDCEKKDSKSNKRDASGDRCRCGHNQHDDSSKFSYSSNSGSDTSYSLTVIDN